MSTDPNIVLLVEDDDAHAELTLINFMSAEKKHKLIHLSDGEEAINYFDENPNYVKPKLVILDLRLPKIDGFEVLEKLKSKNALADLPVIILSTSYSQLDAEKAFNLGANSYLVKPLDFDKYKDMINQVCKYWIKWNVQVESV